jgi:hypothetical protein
MLVIPSSPSCFFEEPQLQYLKELWQNQDFGVAVRDLTNAQRVPFLNAIFTNYDYVLVILCQLKANVTET